MFDVVRVAGNSTYNYANPVRRDTVNIGGGDDLVTFRFRTDNPGKKSNHFYLFKIFTDGIKKRTVLLALPYRLG